MPYIEEEHVQDHYLFYETYGITKMKVLVELTAPFRFHNKISVLGVDAPLDLKEAAAALEQLVSGQIAEWLLSPAGKAWTIAYYQKLSTYSTFIETGTFKGATISLVAPLFERCHTMELDEALYWRTRARLNRLHPNVFWYCGSSAELLPD